MQWQGGTATEGIHNAAGTIGIAVPGRNSTSWIANNDAWNNKKTNFGFVELDKVAIDDLFKGKGLNNAYTKGQGTINSGNKNVPGANAAKIGKAPAAKKGEEGAINKKSIES